MFHVEHKTRLSNLGHYSLCLNAKISLSLSSPEPRAQVGDIQKVVLEVFH